jgi:orotate phosphoribosyltransferase
MTTCTTFSVAELNQLIVDNLHRIRALPFDVVVHVPRSGTIPASLIATYLIKPLASVDEYCAGIVNTRKSDAKTIDRILVVEDSVRTGEQMRDAVTRIKKAKPGTKVTTLAVYLTEDLRRDKRVLVPDLHLRTSGDSFYMMPWYMWKTHRLEQACVDLDGVLCRDATPEEDDDGVNYQRFLEAADLKFKPHIGHIGWIVTGRLEKYREPTVRWLERNNIDHRKLVMGSWATKAERRGNAGGWKGEVYSRTPAKLFIESSEREAKIIAEVSGKTVWCIDTSRTY